MRRLRNKVLIAIPFLVLFLAAGYVWYQMVLVKCSDFQVVYRVGEQDYVDGVVYRKWGDRANRYLYLPNEDNHPWWRFQTTGELLQSTPAPYRLGPIWLVQGVLKGASIDFDVKIGPWDYQRAEQGLEFKNSSLYCSVQFP